MNSKYICMIAGALALLVTSCKHEPPKPVQTDIDPASTQYPLDVANIIVKKCATSGCHNEASYTGAGGLRLDDWQYMFRGGGNGAVAIPYSAKYSSLLYFLNPGTGVYDNISVPPTMPYNQSALSKDEYDVIKKWIINGAPDKNGNVPFATNPDTRQKSYLTMQGCDQVAVIDAETQVVMRYIEVGQEPNIIETPHFISMDDAGRYAYVCFVTGSLIQKIDTRTDKVVLEMSLAGVGGGDGLNFNIVHVSPDGKNLVASQLISSTGAIIYGDAENMTYRAIALVDNPHGIAYNQTFDTFYVTGQYGNTVYRIDKEGDVAKISMDGKTPVTKHGTNTPDAHEIIMSPDFSKYFLTCQNTNEVRVMDRLADTLIKVIPTGLKPQEFAMSKVQPYLFVTCLEDVSQVSTLYKGSVYVINYNTLDVVKRIDGEFYQPHGVTVDDKNGVFYVSNLNLEINGPAPHHISDCGGRNGYYTVYDLNTFKRADRKKYEVLPSPYAFIMRFQ